MTSGDLEQRILGVVRDVLDDGGIAADDGWVASGGTSLKAVWLVAGLARETGVLLDLSDVGDATSAVGLTAILSEHLDGSG
ncbi:MAG: phosphopantetheine-binding protein [Actinomycetota bacterium]